jgi:WD40-like Beta Propeller Repeat
MRMLRMSQAGICGFVLLLAIGLPFTAPATAAGVEGRILTVPRPRQIVAVSPRSGAEHVLFRAHDGLIIGPAATRDGGRVAFILRHWGRSWDGSVRVFHLRDEVWVMRGNGDSAHPVLALVRRLRGSRWAYPPPGAAGGYGALESIDIADDGSRLVLSRGGFLYTMGIDGEGLRRVRTQGAAPTVETGSDITGPQLTPGGRRIVADFVAQGEVRIGAVPIGGGRVELLPSRRPPLAPSYSDDGRWIVFAATGPSPPSRPHWAGRDAIWIMRADGGGERQIVDRPGFSFYNPDFSPDGRRIVFAGPCRSHESRIVGKDRICSYVVDVDGSGLRRVESGLLRLGANENPEWTR